MKSSFPQEWKPDCPETYNRWQRHIRFLLHSDGDPHELAKRNIEKEFNKLKQSINPDYADNNRSN